MSSEFVDPLNNAYYRVVPYGGWMWKVYNDRRFPAQLYVHPQTRDYVPAPTNDNGAPRFPQTPHQTPLNTSNTPASPAASNPINYIAQPLVGQASQPRIVSGSTTFGSPPGAQIPTIASVQDSKPYETLDPDYKKPKNGKNFFRIGRVFSVMWSEPAGHGANTQASEFSLNWLNEVVYSKVTRFVVIREGHESCSVLKITTYGRQGLAKRGLKRAEHGIVYTGDTPPTLQQAELDKDDLMRAKPIRVIPKTNVDRLDVLSRINYTKVSTVEHNVKVKEIGKVWDLHLNDLLGQFHDIYWNKSQKVAQQTTI